MEKHLRKLKVDENDKKTLKVLKYNQEISSNLLADARKINADVSKSINESEEFLSRLENELGIETKSKISKTDPFVRESELEPLEAWDELVEQANQRYDDVSFEELLSKEEFRAAYDRIAEIDAEFEKKTGLRKADFAFLTVAIALQCLRQYVLDPFIKEKRSKASSSDEKGKKNNTDAGWYHVDTDKILTNRVPFDVQHYGTNSTISGFLKGGDHRSMTLGHDPILGWVFGTANIMTSTVTRRDFVSAHVKVINGENKIHSLASTTKVFQAIYDRVTEKGPDGKLALGAALVREGIHLKSDIGTKNSLPVPIVGTLDSTLANKLAEYHIDAASIGTEAALSFLINTIISMVHRMCFDETKDEEKIYEVRTRKIILYSNLIASSSNIVASVITERYDLLDIGGLLITISRLFSDVRFICKVKDEFVQSKLDEEFKGTKEEVDRLYTERFGKKL